MKTRIHPLVLGVALFGGLLALLLLALVVGCDKNLQTEPAHGTKLGTIQADGPGMGFGFSQEQAATLVNSPNYPWGGEQLMAWWPDEDGDGFGAPGDNITLARFEDLQDGRRHKLANNCLDANDANASIHPADPHDGSYHLSCGFDPQLCPLGTLKLVELDPEICGEGTLLFRDNDSDGCGDPTQPLCWHQDHEAPGYADNNRDWDDAIYGCVYQGPNVQLPE